MKSIVAAMIAAFATAEADVGFTSLGEFKLNKAAFLSVSEFKDSDKFLLCSSFSAGPLGTGDVYVVPDITDAVKAGDVSTLKSHKLDLHRTKLQWPNDVSIIPDEVFGFRAIMIPDGFLVPGHSDGGLYIMKMDSEDITKSESVTKISAHKKDYFYHMGHWVDLNQDGRLDFITARSNAKAGGGELVWFEHPKEGLTDATWTEHVITEGPDVGIQVIEDSPYKHSIVVFAAEFFNEKVSFYVVSTKDGTLTDSRVIDTEILSAYSVTFADLNGDGHAELMVNNHETDDSLNGIWVYEQPRNWLTGDWTKHQIASDFINAKSLFVPNMAPGFPYPFYPQTNKEHHLGNAAHIVVAGDGDHSAWIMTPTDTHNYEWDRTLIKDMKGTVGALTFADLDQDGWEELWVPNYDDSRIEVFRFHHLEEQQFLQ